MSKIDDGGPAFAVRMGCDTNGMSLRDWFAGMALQSLAGPFVATKSAIIINEQAADMEIGASQLIAKMSYEFADAMIEVRKEES